ncbi:hypothetical protein LP43_0217 [Methylophaga thiooxydans]|uniref:DUF3311 domain-containing protein n=1 Tax=Methylophaga thiooxydans TaxID=392484 RepID=A0A0A0BIN4_9GAMM|nr:hypothetical protein [Methylophaga thiooxydans]KGM07801.1 hypothetical protein LP43_0217 [Methylophaga thiooxydans]
MSAKPIHSRRRTALFITLILATTFLTTFPPIFLWANTIEPRVFGLPFAMIWHIGLALVGAVFFASWYLLESRSGAIDMNVEIEEAR